MSEIMCKSNSVAINYTRIKDNFYSSIKLFNLFKNALQEKINIKKWIFASKA